jgi:DNA-3-methyladenine glycosylase
VHLVRVGPGADRREGRIVEVEAYIGEDDLASHARFGRTERNAIMYERPGLAYVYMVYGMHDCLNVVTEPPGSPAAILIRAIEPIVGIDAMRLARIDRELGRRRLDAAGRARVVRRLERLGPTRLAAGPGALTAAFGIDRSATGVDLLDQRSEIRLVRPPAGVRGPQVRTTPRIGVSYAGQRWAAVEWRFVDASSPLVALRGH